jgi:DNA modification methylase
VTLNRCIQGDCRDVMRQLIADGVRVQTIVTSPPYWNLRDYGVAGQIGMERTLQEFVATMVDVFDLARELLADDGTLWLNLGDSYAANRGYQVPSTLMNGDATNQAQAGSGRGMKASDIGLKPKDLCGVPWRVAFALQDSGWYLRQDIIWAKPNPMPESVRDRCTKAHEYLFLLTKSPKYYFDQEAILEPCSPGTHARLSQDVQNQIGSERANGGAKTNGNMKAVARKPGNVNPPKGQLAYEAGDDRHRTKAGLLAYAEKQRLPAGWATGTERREHRNLRGNYTEERKVYPGTGVGFGRGTDAEQRGRGRVKNNESFDAAMAIMPTKRNRRSVWTIPTQSYSEAHFATFPEALVEPCILAGSRPGDIVFDPFMGSGTVAQVAQRLGRKWLGSELNPEYIELQGDRTRQAGLEFAA